MTDTPDPYKGYRGRGRELLKRLGARVWSDCTITTDTGEFSGIILPRSEQADDRHIVLKMNTGYNIGIAVERIQSIVEHDYKEAHYKIPEQEFPFDPAKPNVTLLGTGGTIASRLDYRTGAVIPAFSPGELYGACPELADICNLETKKLFGVFSENMGPEQYLITAREIAKQIENGVAGIIIGHGTDTLHHTAAAMSYMLQDLPVPVILVGSQRSSDRPSSDAAFNLQCAAQSAAHGELAEVLVCMFGPTSDRYNLLHRGTRVRKMHSSYRSTFRTLGDTPLATVTPEAPPEPLRRDFTRRDPERKLNLYDVFEERVAIVYYYPNMQPDIIESLIDNGYKGIVIAGTGLGHVNKPLYEPLRKACESGVQVYMTVQTLWGYAQMYVYDTGRDLMELGVVPLANMLPEAAYIKLGWALGMSDDAERVKELMLTPVNGEITEREQYNAYVVLQGGLPEVDAFLHDHWR
ncbi:MAG: Glu-tRNA(Gln) amidotransferase subunit GatD [Candidatus Coatesbacteria bacterium]|nr:Glu-tRNA(Gln) amidotransferase subunit GatD [Candidatus Coatesbacteria bacterium]